MIKVTRNDLPKLATELRSMANAARRDPVAQAITGVAFRAKDMLTAGMATAFESPTRWTLNSTYVEPAKEGKLEASVHFKDRLSSGVPAGRFLRAQILGGERGMKTFERVLARRGLLPDGMRLVPGAGAEIDAEGNMAMRQLSAIVHGLTGTTMRKRGAKGGSDVRYFAILPGSSHGGLRPGIYVAAPKGQGRLVVPVLAYVRTMTYAPRFDFAGIASRVVAEELPKRLARAADRIWREARR